MLSAWIHFDNQYMHRKKKKKKKEEEEEEAAEEAAVKWMTNNLPPAGDQSRDPLPD